jgi:predicted nucleic acid-binding protein
MAISEVIVVDASVIVELLLRRPRAASAAAIVRNAIQLHAPAHLDVEVIHALRRRWLAREIEGLDAFESIGRLGSLLILRADLPPLMRRVWELRENFTAYDAAYVALAEHLEATLITCDARLARASGHRARVHLVE